MGKQFLSVSIFVFVSAHHLAVIALYRKMNEQNPKHTEW